MTQYDGGGAPPAPPEPDEPEDGEGADDAPASGEETAGE